MVNAEGIALLSAASAEVAVKVGMLAWTTLISIPSSTRLRVATNPLYSKSLVFFSFFFVFSFLPYGMLQCNSRQNHALCRMYFLGLHMCGGI